MSQRWLAPIATTPTKFGTGRVPRSRKPFKQNIMKRVSIKDFAKAEGFSQIYPTVRASVNDRPFVTLLKVVDGKNVGENIYFSGSSVTEGQAPKLGDNFLEVVGNWEIGYVTPKGQDDIPEEERITVPMLVRKGGSYVDISLLFD